MEFRVLGSLEVLDGAEPVDITAPQQRKLLAVLLVSANQVVPLDRIIEHLWADRPPPRATAAVQMYVSSLRRAFEPDRSQRSPSRSLPIKPPGYLLVVDDDHFDATRFTAGVAPPRIDWPRVLHRRRGTCSTQPFGCGGARPTPSSPSMPSPTTRSPAWRIFRPWPSKLGCSVAVDLRISEVVDAPNWVVSAFLPQDLFVRA